MYHGQVHTMDLLSFFQRLPGDIRRLVGLTSGYRAIQTFMCSCKDAYKMFATDANFWRLMRQSRVLEKSVDDSKPVLHSDLFPMLAITKLSKQRQDMGKEIVRLALNQGGLVYGGFVRDYISRRKEFSDIDIHFTQVRRVQSFLLALAREEYKVSEIYIKEWRGYQSHLTEGGQQMRYKVGKGQIAFEIDIRTKCGLSDDGADFDINGFYISATTPYAEATVYSTDLGHIRHLTWADNKASDHARGSSNDQVEYRQKLIKARALMVDKFNKTIKNCKDGKFLFAKGYKANPKKYTDRLVKMTGHGYICAEKPVSAEPSKTASGKTDQGWKEVNTRRSRPVKYHTGTRPSSSTTYRKYGN